MESHVTAPAADRVSCAKPPRFSGISHVSLAGRDLEEGLAVAATPLSVQRVVALPAAGVNNRQSSGLGSIDQINNELDIEEDK